MRILDPRRLFGQEGEATAERYLRRKGYRIIAKNLRSSLGELDLIAEDGSVLVFVEVKARRTQDFGGAVHAVHRQKQEKLIRLAAQFLDTSSKSRLSLTVGRKCVVPARP